MEVTIQATHVLPEIQHERYPQRIAPDKWRPLIMSFRQFYGLSARVQNSRLAEGDEARYAPRKRRP